LELDGSFFPLSVKNSVAHARNIRTVYHCRIAGVMIGIEAIGMPAFLVLNIRPTTLTQGVLFFILNGLSLMLLTAYCVLPDSGLSL